MSARRLPKPRDAALRLLAINRLLLPIRDEYVSVYEDAYSSPAASSTGLGGGSRNSGESDPTALAALSSRNTTRRNTLKNVFQQINDAEKLLINALAELKESWGEGVEWYDKVCIECGDRPKKRLKNKLCEVHYMDAYRKGRRLS